MCYVIVGACVRVYIRACGCVCACVQVCVYISYWTFVSYIVHRVCFVLPCVLCLVYLDCNLLCPVCCSYIFLVLIFYRA